MNIKSSKNENLCFENFSRVFIFMDLLVARTYRIKFRAFWCLRAISRQANEYGTSTMVENLDLDDSNCFSISLWE